MTCVTVTKARWERQGTQKALRADMTTIRRFTCDDLFRFNNVNLDWYTETVSTSMPTTVILRTY